MELITIDVMLAADMSEDVDITTMERINHINVPMKNITDIQK